MSLGGFTSVVNIIRSRTSGGFTNNGMPYQNAEMDLEGKLLDFNYGDLRDSISRDTKTYVSVEIEFTETQETSIDVPDDDNSYIGTIRLSYKKDYDDFDKDIIAIVRITLPGDMFSKLYSFDEKLIRFETIHDIIESPTEDQKTDNIVALVKRAYFEVTNDLHSQ